MEIKGLNRQQLRFLEREADRQIIKDLLNNPLLAALLIFIVVEALQKVKVGENQEPLMGNNVGTLLEGAAIATPVMVAMAKSGAINEMVKAAGETTKGLTGLLPMLIAAG
jgi:hypothetical protein